jgi:NADH:ubiquinone oxidoreductase subunit B-like Fe-S oxidoreductase
VIKFNVRYWFDSDSRDRSGEQVTEIVEAGSVQEVAAQVQDRMAQPTFVITPSFGPAQQGGMVVIQSSQVRYVEVIPPGPTRF